jgi:hypothetical protein
MGWSRVKADELGVTRCFHRRAQGDVSDVIADAPVVLPCETLVVAPMRVRAKASACACEICTSPESFKPRALLWAYASLVRITSSRARGRAATAATPNLGNLRQIAMGSGCPSLL